jgi:hypothetical protein
VQCRLGTKGRLILTLGHLGDDIALMGAVWAMSTEI